MLLIYNQMVILTSLVNDEVINMCDIELKEDISELMRDTMIGVLTGDINLPDVLVELQKIGKSIPDILFYKNIECMLDGLDKKGTIKRKVGKNWLKVIMVRIQDLCC